MNEKLLEKVQDLDRLQEIVRLRLHEEEADAILQQYVERASKEFDLPIGLVSIVLDEVQKFAASTGLGGWLDEVQGTPVEWSFCANSVGTGAPFVVANAPEHELVKDNPLVTQDGVRCYAGVPLTTENGHVVGNFCVIGDKSRNFSQAEIDRLHEYAAQVMQRLEERVKER